MAMKLIYKYYVINSDNKIVSGFQTEQQAVEYAGRNRYKVYSSKTLGNKGFDAKSLENWSVALFDSKVSSQMPNGTDADTTK